MYCTRPQITGLTNNQRLAFSVVLLVCMLLCLALLGNMQGTDLDKEQELYCKAVDAGVYPDYNGTFQKMCPQAKDNHSEQ